MIATNDHDVDDCNDYYFYIMPNGIMVIIIVIVVLLVVAILTKDYFLVQKSAQEMENWYIPKK